jgi:hypothetical protein
MVHDVVILVLALLVSGAAWTLFVGVRVALLGARFLEEPER